MFVDSLQFSEQLKSSAATRATYNFIHYLSILFMYEKTRAYIHQQILPNLGNKTDCLRYQLKI